MARKMRKYATEIRLSGAETAPDRTDLCVKAYRECRGDAAKEKRER